MSSPRRLSVLTKNNSHHDRQTESEMAFARQEGGMSKPPPPESPFPQETAISPRLDLNVDGDGENNRRAAVVDATQTSHACSHEALHAVAGSLQELISLLRRQEEREEGHHLTSESRRHADGLSNLLTAQSQTFSALGVLVRTLSSTELQQ